MATIRESILEAIKTKLAAARKGEPAIDPYSITWSEVVRGPLSPNAYKKIAALGLQDTEERSSWKQGFRYAALTLTIHFALYVNREDEASTVANAAIGDLLRAMREDVSFGGLAINVQDESNEIYIFDDDPRHVEGAIIFTVSYRHRENDPRRAA